jgi:hypothetical protein
VKKQTSYEEFLQEMRRNAVLSKEYKDHLIQLFLTAVSEGYKRGERSRKKS